MQKHGQNGRARYPAYPSEKNAEHEDLSDQKPVILNVNNGENCSRQDYDRPCIQRRPQPASEQKPAEERLFTDRNEDDDRYEEQWQQIRAFCCLIDVALKPVDDVTSGQPATASPAPIKATTATMATMASRRRGSL